VRRLRLASHWTPGGLKSSQTWHEHAWIRHVDWRILKCMATLERKREAERAMLELIENGGLPQPDWIEYGERCIRVFWNESKLVVIVDLDE